MRNVIIEAHLCGKSEDIIPLATACRRAGAAVVHVAERSGRLAETIRRIRDECDVLIAPTVSAPPTSANPDSVLSLLEVLTADPTTRPDMIAVDMGSVNYEQYDPVRHTFSDGDAIFRNPTSGQIQLSRFAAQAGIIPKLVCWDLGSIRRVERFIETGVTAEPVFLEFVLTEGTCIASHACTFAGIEAYLVHMPRGKKCSWAVRCIGGGLDPVAAQVCGLGGHLVVDSDDAAAVVRQIESMAAYARTKGRGTASPASARSMLAGAMAEGRA